MIEFKCLFGKLKNFERKKKRIGNSKERKFKRIIITDV